MVLCSRHPLQSSVLRLYLHAGEDMEVATREGTQVTLAATQDIMTVMSVAGLEGLQEAPSRGVTF